MSAGGGGNYLSDGLSEELSMRLAQVPGLRVAARTSAFEFKGRNVDVRRIGEALGVRHVLEGSVRRDGDSLRVIVQLIDASNGYHVWSGSYDREWRDVLAIQDEVARSITAALRVVLTPAAERELAGKADVDARAFDPYLAGLAMLQQSADLSRLNEAGKLFREAVRIDPGFARAHAGLCDVGVRRHYRTSDPADLLTAEASCKEALALNPSLVETEKALAALYVAGGKHDQASTIYRGLIARNAADADGHIGLGSALQGAGHLDAAEQSFRRAVEAEPTYWRASSALGTFLYQRGRIGEAIKAYRRVTALTPASAVAYNNLGAALQMTGDLTGSAEAYRRSLTIEPTRAAYSNLGTVYYYLGQYTEASTYHEKAAALAAQTQWLWGNLADSVWQIPQRRPEALGYYRRAIGLAERELASVPDDARVMAQLAFYYQRVGDPGRSTVRLARAMELGRDSPYVAYYAAATMMARGDAAEAARLASLAVKNGYPRALLDADPILGSTVNRRSGLS
jgi:TolB-like protein